MIHRPLRSFFIHTFALWFIATNIGGIDYGNDLKILALGGIALSLADMLLKPLINLLLLPFNLITLGLFRWVSGLITLYIATTAVSGFSIVPFTYQGFNSSLIVIPQIPFLGFTSYIIVAFLISFITSFFFWLAGAKSSH